MNSASGARELLRAQELARAGRLYPSVIVHGAGEAERRAAAVELARTLLCERVPEERPCGSCRQCARIAAPGEERAAGDGEAPFHPDFAWLERDLKTSTSAESTRDFLRAAQLTPYEARGQLFVVADAASLSGEAADSLLKAIEEPALTVPRHFLLLAPSRFDLPPTLRSRSLALYLGAGERPDAKRVAKAARAVRESLARAAAPPSEAAALFRLDVAATLAGDSDFSDPRAAEPWRFAAAVALAAASPGGEPELGVETRRRLLALAEALLNALPMRLRGIPADRICEGLVADHLSQAGSRGA